MKRLILILTFILFSLQIIWAANEQDSLALVALYNSANGDNWTKTNNWLSADSSISTWYGVTVDSGRVTEIKLLYNKLSGVLTSEIGSLTALKKLDISNNSIGGAIPAEIGLLSKLKYLSLSRNSFSGQIPQELSALINLETLYLKGDSLSGTIPAELGNLTGLKILDLSYNNFSGLIPAELGNLNNLQTLDLRFNQLSGYIPSELGELTSIVNLYLGYNNFSGQLPASLENLENLHWLDISFNRLAAIPDFSGSAMGNSIIQFYVQGNHLDFSSIEPNIGLGVSYIYSPQDSIGENIDTMLMKGSSYTMNVSAGGASTHYQWLKDGDEIAGATDSIFIISSIDDSDAGSYSCIITNSVATDLTIYSRPINIHIASGLTVDSLALVAFYDSTNGDNWTNNDNWLSSDSALSTWYGVTVSDGRVERIKLTNNNLVGPLPNELGKLDQLTAINFAGNKINGNLPDSLVNLSNLRFLGLQNNQLTGNIPDWIGQLHSLELLVLPQNQFTGEIPESLTNLKSLWNLALSSNRLSGSIPSSIGNIKSLSRLSLSYNQLSGSIPNSLGRLKNLTSLVLNHNNFTGEIPDSIQNLSELRILSLDYNNLSGTMPKWLGNLNNLYSLKLNKNNFYGNVPDTLRNLAKLKYLYLSFNKFDYFPDLSALSSVLTNVEIRNNNLTFEDIEPNMVFQSFFYSPQDSVGEETDTTLTVGDSITFSVDVGGSANHYQWYKDGEALSGDTLSVYKIDSVKASDSGTYICRITNDIVSGLTLYSRSQKLHIDVGTAVNDNKLSSQPMAYALRQNYPNPFNPSTKIAYALPEAADVTITVYNTLGQKVAVLLKAKKPAGYHSVTFNASSLSTGIYYYEIKAGDFQQIKKMVLIK